MVNKDSNFIKGVKLFQKNYKPPKQPRFRIYYDDTSGVINEVTDQPSNNEYPYIAVPYKDVKAVLNTSLARYIVKNKKLIKWNPHVHGGLHLTRIHDSNSIIPDKVIYCTVKGQPGILVMTVETVVKVDFDRYEIYQ